MSIFAPKRQLRGGEGVGALFANIGNVWELVCNNNSPNNRHKIAKLFIK